MSIPLRSRAGALVSAGALLVCAAPTPAAAQDAHYWTLQYGPRSSLLGGAVIGSVDDVSATFYNPGAVAQATDLAFAVSTDVFEYTGIKLEDGGGEGVDLGTSRSGLQPSLVAGILTRGLFGGNGILAYSALTRSRGTQDIAGAAIRTGDRLPPASGLDDLAGAVDFTGEFSDLWAGLTYSHAVGERFGLGVSWYGALRNQNRRRQAIAQFVGSDGSGLSIIDNARGKYTSLRTLLKFGSFGRFGSVTAGATVTTPSLHVTGSGELGLIESAFGTDTTGLAATVQTGLPAEYRSPLSIGAGAAWSLGAARVHGSVEWFDRVDRYVVIQGDSVTAQEPESVRFLLDAVQEQTEVLNWGAGLEYSFNPNLSAYASFFTDASSLDDDIERSSLSIIPIDIRTLTVGADFVVRSARFTLGVGYGWGRELDRELTDLLRQDDPDFVATYVYRSVKLLFGFEIGVN